MAIVEPAVNGGGTIMTRTTDPVGEFLRDFAIALALSYLPALLWSGLSLGSFHPVAGLVAMASLVLTHGWLVASTWHGRIALVVLVLVLYLVGRYVRPAGWVRGLALLATLIAWGAYIAVAPEMLGDGLPR